MSARATSSPSTPNAGGSWSERCQVEIAIVVEREWAELAPRECGRGEGTCRDEVDAIAHGREVGTVEGDALEASLQSLGQRRPALRRGEHGGRAELPTHGAPPQLADASDALEGIAHLGGGVQYLANRYTGRLREAGVASSFGSVGDWYDYALAESTIGLFKAE